MKRTPVALALALVAMISPGCTLLSGGGDVDPAQARALAHDLRMGLEPILDEVIARQEDPELTQKYERAKTVADAIAVAWDAYLASEGDDDRARLVAALNAGLDAADELVPQLTGDEDAVFYAKATIGILKVVISQVARQLDEPAVEVRADLIPSS